MGLPVRQQAVYWGIAAAVFLLLLWALGDVILPFLVGGALAYSLDPLADALERLGLSRILATITISLITIVIFVLAALIVIPLMIDQLLALVNAAPELSRQLQSGLSERFPALEDPDSTLRQSLASFAAFIQSKGGALLNQVLASAVSVINAAIFIIVVPVVAFYLLLDWDNMIARIDALLPRDHAPVIRDLAYQIDRVLASFVRGQLTVCVILGSFYSIALMMVGLSFGLIVGAIAGLLTFIPYVGSLVGGTLAIGLALFQFWGDWLWIALVAVIFFGGQIVEGNILTPNLVGGSVGLHPVWLLFALSAFGALFGFAGLLVAVPVAASIGVLIRYGTSRYTSSRLYRGVIGQDDGDA